MEIRLAKDLVDHHEPVEATEAAADFLNQTLAGGFLYGQTITIVVGAGHNNGNDGDGYYRGARGQASVIWS